MRMMIRGFAFGLALAEVILNMAITGFYSLSRTAYLAKMDDYEILLEQAKMDAALEAGAKSKVFYRVEDTERKTKNDDSLYGYPSATIFSSLMNIEVSRFYQSVYMEGGKNYYCYNGATPIVSAMLSVKYMLSDNPNGTNALRELVGTSGNYYLYENRYYLPLGFVMSEEVIENWDNDTDSKIHQLNELSNALGADRDMLSPAAVKIKAEAGVTEISIKEDGIYYGFYNNCSSDNLTIRLNGGEGTRYGKTSHRYLLELGECKAGDTVTITNPDNEMISFTIYQLNLEAVDMAYETLSRQTMVTESFTDTNIKGHIQIEEAGNLILPIPKEEGWTLYVDGEKNEIKDFKETFISVYLKEGYHSIELKYMTPGLKQGAVISGVCVGLFILSMYLRRRRHGQKND